jgi:hypothetical protein
MLIVQHQKEGSMISLCRTLVTTVICLLFCLLVGGCSSWSFSKQAPTSDLVTIQCNGVVANSVPQTSKTSCWAACAESLFRYNNRPDQTQARIAERLGKVATTDAAGNPLPQAEIDQRIQAAAEWEIMLALYPEFSVTPDEFSSSALAWLQSADTMTERGKWNAITAGASWLSREALVADTMARSISPKSGKPQPVLVGFAGGEMGHVCLVYGFDIKPGERSWIGRQTEGTVVDGALLSIKPGAIYNVRIMDPEGARTTTMTASVFEEQLDFYITREMAIERLEGLKRTVMLDQGR